MKAVLIGVFAWCAFMAILTSILFFGAIFDPNIDWKYDFMILMLSSIGLSICAGFLNQKNQE